jgi:GNAT superfamily N-acetyltransferase
MATIRDYRPADAGRVWALLELGLGAYGIAPDACATDRDLENVQAHYLDRGGRFRILVEDEETIGMYGLYRIDSAVVELRKMYLDTRHKGHGHGERLLDDALRIARAAGYRTMILQTNRVLVEAIGLYRKYGFEDRPGAELATRCDCAMQLQL